MSSFAKAHNSVFIYSPESFFGGEYQSNRCRVVLMRNLNWSFSDWCLSAFANELLKYFTYYTIIWLIEKKMYQRLVHNENTQLSFKQMLGCRVGQPGMRAVHKYSALLHHYNCFKLHVLHPPPSLLTPLKGLNVWIFKHCSSQQDNCWIQVFVHWRFQTSTSYLCKLHIWPQSASKLSKCNKIKLLHAILKLIMKASTERLDPSSW